MFGRDLSFKTTINGKVKSIGLILEKDLEKGNLSKIKNSQSLNLGSLEKV